MSHNLLDVISVKNCITEFIIKLYSILEKHEYHDIISWSPNNREVIIRDQKALEREVLPMFFRHSKIDSFIRQLNMYGFRKVAKGTCQRNAICFKNENFRRGNMYIRSLFSESLVLIKRRKRVLWNSQHEEQTTNQQDCEIQKFKEFVKGNITVMQEHIMRLRREYPMVASDFTRALQISNILIGRDMNHQLSDFEPVEPHMNMFKTIKDIHVKQQDGLASFGSRCSIEDYSIYA